MRNLVVVLAAFAALAACKKDKPNKIAEAPSNVETGASSPPPAAVRAKLQLPRPTGQPPLKTTGVFDQATMDKIGAPSFPGWEKTPHGGLNGHVEVKQETIEHPKILVWVTIDPCKDTCTPMELAKWQDGAKQDELKDKLMGSGLKAAPDTVWELGQTTLNGVPMIFAYVLGQALQNGGSFGESYTLFYNDGANQLRIIAQYDDDPLQSKEIMAKYVPRELLEKVAKTFMDAYGQIW